MNKYFIFPLIILVSGIVSCNKPPGSAHPPAQFHADSIAILAKANQFRLDKEYDSAISLLDSAFLSKATNTPTDYLLTTPVV